MPRNLQRGSQNSQQCPASLTKPATTQPKPAREFAKSAARRSKFATAAATTTDNRQNSQRQPRQQQNIDNSRKWTSGAEVPREARRTNHPPENGGGGRRSITRAAKARLKVSAMWRARHNAKKRDRLTQPPSLLRNHAEEAKTSTPGESENETSARPERDPERDDEGRRQGAARRTCVAR